MKINSSKTKAVAALKQATQRPYTKECSPEIKVDGAILLSKSVILYTSELLYLQMELWKKTWTVESGSIRCVQLAGSCLVQIQSQHHDTN